MTEQQESVQSIGNVTSVIVDRWAWWQEALKGNIGPIHENEPQQGYYRTRRKNGPWEPVAIFYPEDTAELVAYRDGREVRDINGLWVWCCRNPISFEAYERAMSGGGFKDEPKTATIGDNSGDADPFEALKIELAGERELAEGFLKTKIETQDQADQAGIWAKRLNDLSKRADGQRTTEKEPHLTRSRAVDDKWRPIIGDAKDLAKSLKQHVEPFLLAAKRAEQERARKAAEEAERKRQEALKAESEEQRAEALQAAQQAEKAAEVQNASAGRTGAKVSIRTEETAIVNDYHAAAKALVDMNHKDLLATIDQLAKRALKAGMLLEGCEKKTIEKVV